MITEAIIFTQSFGKSNGWGGGLCGGGGECLTCLANKGDGAVVADVNREELAEMGTWGELQITFQAFVLEPTNTMSTQESWEINLLRLQFFFKNKHKLQRLCNYYCTVFSHKWLNFHHTFLDSDVLPSLIVSLSQGCLEGWNHQK